MTNMFLYFTYLYILPEYGADNVKMEIKKQEKSPGIQWEEYQGDIIGIGRMVEFHYTCIKLDSN